MQTDPPILDRVEEIEELLHSLKSRVHNQHDPEFIRQIKSLEAALQCPADSARSPGRGIGPHYVRTLPKMLTGIIVFSRTLRGQSHHAISICH
jgi:hypothetical protein